MNKKLIILQGAKKDTESKIAIVKIIYRTKNFVLHRSFGVDLNSKKRGYTISWTNNDGEIFRVSSYYNVKIKTLKNVVDVLQMLPVNFQLTANDLRLETNFKYFHKTVRLLENAPEKANLYALPNAMGIKYDARN